MSTRPRHVTLFRRWTSAVEIQGSRMRLSNYLRLGKPIQTRGWRRDRHRTKSGPVEFRVRTPLMNSDPAEALLWEAGFIPRELKVPPETIPGFFNEPVIQETKGPVLRMDVWVKSRGFSSFSLLLPRRLVRQPPNDLSGPLKGPRPAPALDSTLLADFAWPSHKFQAAAFLPVELFSAVPVVPRLHAVRQPPSWFDGVSR
jgi:hypothetical protein